MRCATARAPTRLRSVSWRCARSPISSATICARARRRYSPHSHRRYRRTRWRNRRRWPMRTPSQRPPTRSRAKPCPRDRGAPRFTRGAPSAGGLGGRLRGPPSPLRALGARPDALGARRALGGLGGPFEAPLLRRARSRRAPIHSGRAERWGVWGALSRPPFFAARDRGAPRFTRGRRALGGLGGPFEAPLLPRVIEARPDSLGAAERWGVWGALSRPPVFAARDRGGPRFTRGAPSAGGLGGPFRGPPSSPRVIEARPDSLEARRALGGLGAFRGPPSSPRVIEARPDSLEARRALGGLGAFRGPPSWRRGIEGGPDSLEGGRGVGGLGGVG